MSEKLKKSIEYTNLAILPVRDTVLFPNAILPLTVGRESSLELINSLPEGEKYIGVIAQRDPRVDAPQTADLYQIGAVAYVHKIIKLPTQSLFIFVEGLERIALEEVLHILHHGLHRVGDEIDSRLFSLVDELLEQRDALTVVDVPPRQLGRGFTSYS